MNFDWDKCEDTAVIIALNFYAFNTFSFLVNIIDYQHQSLVYFIVQLHS